MIDASDVEHTVGWFEYGQDVRIDVADINDTFQQFKFIRVMDTATPRGDISRVSLYCSDATSIPEVRILLGAMLDVGFPASFDTVIPTSGCRHWGLPLLPGGSDDAFVVENTVAQETKVVLAAAISGDLTGKVLTGQVFRLQVTDGVIADDVQATWPDLRLTDDVGEELDYSIQHIEAKSITGRIIAGDEIGRPTNMAPALCSIRSILVGLTFPATSQGIRGDVLAYGGHIRHIESTGHIGTAENPVNIHAGFGLAELFCTAQENGQPAPRDVLADIAVNLLAPTTGSTHDYDGFVRRNRRTGTSALDSRATPAAHLPSATDSSTPRRPRPSPTSPTCSSCGPTATATAWTTLRTSRPTPCWTSGPVTAGSTTATSATATTTATAT
ncbi:MAG: hypothetical protein DYG92_12855, partial [Leptolyngbya sp. PLA1]|nr:hypothetical protein [Leptolyngbya sp. PLA1]